MLRTPLSSEKLRPEWKYIAEVTNEDEMFSLLRPIDGSFARRDLILLEITHVLPDDFCVNIDKSGMLSLAVRPSFTTVFADSMSDINKWTHEFRCFSKKSDFGESMNFSTSLARSS